MAHAAHDGRYHDLPVADIHPNPDQPRKRFARRAALDALVDSISERVVLQPIIVRPDAVGGSHLVAGQRRFRAGQRAELSTITALVDDQVDGAEALESL